MTSRNPTLAEVLQVLRDGIFRDLRVSLPGEIKAFDAATNTADVQPLVREAIQVDGEDVYTSLDVLTGVPVLFPSGGGLRVTFPMSVGDQVMLLFADRSIDYVLDQGKEGSPVDRRRHALSDAVAIPSFAARPKAWTNIEAGVITLGSDAGSNSDFIALAAKVKNEISALRDTVSSALSSLSGHTHSVAGIQTAGPPAAHTQTAPVNTTPGPTLQGPASVGDVACTTVKVRD